MSLCVCGYVHARDAFGQGLKARDGEEEAVLQGLGHISAKWYKTNTGTKGQFGEEVTSISRPPLYIYMHLPPFLLTPTPLSHFFLAPSLPPSLPPSLLVSLMLVT
jgi:hypothetical protein